MDRTTALRLLKNPRRQFGDNDDDIAEWNRLRAAGEPVPSLAGVDLSDTELCQCDLRGIDLREACLRKANLSGANLSGADLSRAFLCDAIFGCANLRKANLREACLYRADFYDYANLAEADLRGADLRGVRMRETYARGADLRGADLSPADFLGPEMAYLRYVNLRDANLGGANLFRACLNMVNLRRAILREADLREACLTAADLHDADLGQANLCGTDLRRTSLTAESLRGHALFDESTRFEHWETEPTYRYKWESKDWHSVFVLDPGSAAAEDIAELLRLISALNRSLGGSGFRFEQRFGVFVFASSKGESDLTSTWDARVAHIATEIACQPVFEAASLRVRWLERYGEELITPTARREFQEQVKLRAKVKGLAQDLIRSRDNRISRALSRLSRSLPSESEVLETHSQADAMDVYRWVTLRSCGDDFIHGVHKLHDGDFFEDFPEIADCLRRLTCFYKRLADRHELSLAKIY